MQVTCSKSERAVVSPLTSICPLTPPYDGLLLSVGILHLERTISKESSWATPFLREID